MSPPATAGSLERKLTSVRPPRREEAPAFPFWAPSRRTSFRCRGLVPRGDRTGCRRRTVRSRPRSRGRRTRPRHRGATGSTSDQVDSIQPLVPSRDDRAVTDVADDARRRYRMSIVRRSASVTGSRIPTGRHRRSRNQIAADEQRRIPVEDGRIDFASPGRAKFCSRRCVERGDVSAGRPDHGDRSAVVDELDGGRPSRSARSVRGVGSRCYVEHASMVVRSLEVPCLAA